MRHDGWPGCPHRFEPEVHERLNHCLRRGRERGLELARAARRIAAGAAALLSGKLRRLITPLGRNAGNRGQCSPVQHHAYQVADGGSHGVKDILAKAGTNQIAILF